ncbi:UNVERIFIED_CONTAM: G3E family GTPase [Acetivibrio alkalicellulosi]
MKKNIQLYLISGFLGSGKTTFLKQLLEQSNKKVGVIVNEFGSVGIDGKVLQKEDLKMVEINNGSIFCACLKGGFVKALVAFLEKPIDVLFIEASGMADPSGMKNLLEQLTVLLEKNSEITQQFEYKGSICIVDAVRFEDFSEMFQPVTNQVRNSSLIIINKVDEVSETKLKKLYIKLSQLNNKAYVYETSFGQMPIELLDSKVNPNVVLDQKSTNTINNRPKSYTIQMKDMYDVEKMKDFYLELSNDVIRFKGFFKTLEGEIAHADCVGDYIKIDIKSYNININDSFEIVMIGKSGEDYSKRIMQTWNKHFGKKVICFK